MERRRSASRRDPGRCWGASPPFSVRSTRAPPAPADQASGAGEHHCAVSGVKQRGTTHSAVKALPEFLSSAPPSALFLCIPPQPLPSPPPWHLTRGGLAVREGRQMGGLIAATDPEQPPISRGRRGWGRRCGTVAWERFTQGACWVVPEGGSLVPVVCRKARTYLRYIEVLLRGREVG